MEKRDQAKIKSVLTSGDYESVLRCAKNMMDGWKDEQGDGDTAFDTLRRLYLTRGKVAGVKEYLNKLEEEASNA